MILRNTDIKKALRNRQRGFILNPFRFASSGGGSSSTNDPFLGNVSLLLHFNGSNGSSTFTDSSLFAHNVAGVNSPTLITADKKFGTASLLLNTGNTYLSIADNAAFDFGSGNFTIECFLNITSLPSAGQYGGIFCQRNTGSFNFAYAFYLNGDNSGRVRFDWTIDGTSTAGSALSTNPIPTGVWVHCAIVRNGSNVTVYIDGVGGTPASIGSSTIFNSSNSAAIGVLSTGAGGFLNGKIDELRVTKGVARYTANFTPPTEEFPSSGEVLLLHCNGADNSTSFVDSSSLNISVAASGDAKLSTTAPKFGTASAIFDGVSDRISATDNRLALGSGDFTIDFWLNPDFGASANYARFIQFGPNSTTGGLWLVRDATSNPMRVLVQVYTSSYQTVCSGAIGMTNYIWHHVALTRESGVWRLFIDGVLDVTSSYLGTDNISQNTINIGSNSVGSEAFAGKMDEIRIIKNRAMWNSNFTPPTAEY